MSFNLEFCWGPVTTSAVAFPPEKETAMECSQLVVNSKKKDHGHCVSSGDTLTLLWGLAGGGAVLNV